ncbi:MAG: hypothetical protein L6R40_005242 [Gallowayella cf. fulva]|nr:MAG: hypothetical protein L6R40_005242 [Xanthomendoza cf. fulva]
MSNTPIPTSTSLTESAVIPAQLSHVWHLIKLQDFHTWWSKIDEAEEVKGASPETDIVQWKFKDGTVLEVKQEEHSAIDHYITYSIISASPALTYTSVVSTIRCYAVTSGTAEGQTFVTWSANFSSDADADVSANPATGVIEDARFKRKEALADLAAVVGKKK